MKDGFIQAFKKGNAITRLSAIILGFGNLAGKQIIKGILYLAMEVSFICFMIFKGINCLAMLPGLGGRKQQEIWNEKLGVYEYVAGDNSLLILLYGVATLFLIAAYVVLAMSSVKSAYNVQTRQDLWRMLNHYSMRIFTGCFLHFRLGEYLYLPFCHLYL